MKKLSAGIITTAVFVLSLMRIPKVSAESYCGKLSYIVSGDDAVITGFESSPEILDIPGRIDGKEVSAIRENAFYKCDSLKSVTVPETVTSIGHHAFSGCTSLEKVVIKGDISTVGEGCFSGCTDLREISLPDSVKEMGRNSFYKCGKLKSIALPEKLEVIDEGAFSGCVSLESIRLPDSIMRIGDKSFFDCPRIARADIPDSITQLGSCSFGYSEGTCRRVSDFTLAGSKHSLGKAYAQNNGFGYIDTDTERTVSIPTIPIAVVIFSGTGLMFLFIPGKIRHFRLRYEYEN